MDERFPKSSRLRRPREFRAVETTGRFAADDLLVVKAATNGMSTTRLGMAVGRPVGNAVDRNRWKRLIREAFRRNRGQIPTGLDLVVRPRRGARPELETISASLVELTRTISRKLRRS